MMKMNSISRHRHCTHSSDFPEGARQLRNTTSVCLASARSLWHVGLSGADPRMWTIELGHYQTLPQLVQTRQGS